MNVRKYDPRQQQGPYPLVAARQPAKADRALDVAVLDHGGPAVRVQEPVLAVAAPVFARLEAHVALHSQQRT
tara:strand:+ start:149 stop:364 length:216 start_codon:yes stop_codon:yes gene_type:complete